MTKTAVAARMATIRPLLASAVTCRDALSDVLDLDDVAARVDLLAQASPYPRPAWYREERAGDRYCAPLRSGEVLAWAQFAPTEPWELMTWVSDFSGSAIWRERA